MFVYTETLTQPLRQGKMAQKGVKLNKETISCAICLDLLTNPATIPCGHSYCMGCINTHWDTEDGRQLYSCPQCRSSCRPRPTLVKNTMLAELVEDLKSAELKPGNRCAGPKHVACDVCTGRKMRALKSCLTCLASYCEEHLEPHYESPAFQKHKLVAPSKNLQDNIQQKIKDRKKDLKMLQQEVEAINRSANKAVKDSEKIFTELIHLLERKRSDVKQQVRAQQKSEVSRVKELQEKLEQEIAELKRKDAEVEQLSHAEDHDECLDDYHSLPPLTEFIELPSTKIDPPRYFDDVTVAVSEVRDKLLDALHENWTNISRTLIEADVLLPQPQPKIRAEFFKYSLEITMDPNTAFTQLFISEEGRRATVMEREAISDPALIGWSQVLGKETLTGRCYWEVEWSAKGVHVAVAHKNTNARGKNFISSTFGMDEKPWALYCCKDSYHFWCKQVKRPISVPAQPYPRLGVYLDQREGHLSFYKISDTMTLLHSVKTTFTQPVCAAIWISNDPGSTAEFCRLK